MTRVGPNIRICYNMTIEKAKKLLGINALSLSDKQIENIIDCFSAIIEVGIQQYAQQYTQKQQSP